MAGWKDGYTDLEMDDESKMDAVMPYKMETPNYPCGLRICLTHEEFAKLKLDNSCEVGDMLEFKAIACVTSISKSENCCRVELQIQGMQCDLDD